MVSIFEHIDKSCNKLDGFWQPNTLTPCLGAKVFESNVSLKSQKSRIKTRKVYLTKSHMYRYDKTGSKVKFSTMINWKKFEPFVEEVGSIERWGFKLGHSQDFEDFYVNSEEDLESWIDAISGLVIMNDPEDEFVVIQELGKGRYASVNLVQSFESGETFAMKCIEKKNTDFTDSIESIINEVTILRQTAHENIIKLHKVYETSDTVYLVLEKTLSGNLYQHVSKHGSLSETQASSLVKSILEGLSHIHEKNIIHRDLKLENILIDSPKNLSNIKICDFGLSTISQEYSTVFCGSPGYIAPEVLKYQPHTNKIDVFSVGIILFSVLSDSFPFRGASVSEILQKNKDCQIEFKEKIWKKMPEALNLVKKLTAKNPQKRFSVQDALQHPWLNKKRHIASLSTFSQCSHIEEAEELTKATKISNSVKKKSHSNISVAVQ